MANGRAFSKDSEPSFRGQSSGMVIVREFSTDDDDDDDDDDASLKNIF